MLNSTCSLCKKESPIVWSDWDYQDKEKIQLCYECVELMQWKNHLKQILPYVQVCPVCKKKFLSKRTDNKMCYVCWHYFFNKHKEVVDTCTSTGQVRIQQEKLI
jgi:hypothetical protein